MKKHLILFILLSVAIISSACNSATSEPIDTDETNEQTETTDDETITYESENGPIEVPANPERVVVLASFNVGSVMALDVNLVGVDTWAMNNPRYAPYLEGVEEVTDESIEKILELEPDLIIAAPTNNNLDRLEEIAPTVTYTYGQVDYLTQHLEIGKLLNKEAEAQAWIDDFKQRAEAAGEEVKEVHGEDVTVSVIENFDKQLYVFGDNFGRGTEILYQEMKLDMPEAVTEVALTDGYYALSPEVLPEYAGDFIILSNDGEDSSFQETETYQNIPAVQNGHVFEANAAEFYFNDPITLEFQLDFFIESFLGQ
ncbi:iron-hydroxamate ABC transporter substrate-binding protein [Halalkalibacter hemicellulosilyticus]|uniref:Ferrichrome-binding periplasmic protein n=1 Tax=Halalkalibacter hemicellulosilyticusJCM 9152 TaxID=1236971 RepID=W4QCI2_9BACI|nr:iron-hydroxamate ABC transporter substrate-binding protein [Halalkalibacter hemicellulosilyticus]GAE29662.1 ferrichrome-binding periplasmic protein precursor [Halalkalibacter hemicellulosilyticusJCM 9152]